MQIEEVRNIISRALAEDIGPGDITTDAIITKEIITSGDFLIKQEGIIAGLTIAAEVFRQLDKEVVFKIFKPDGAKVTPGEIAAAVTGNASSILKGERTALNFLQRMSGIATVASKYKEQIKHTKAKILDTRKTVPGLRLTDKIAVQLGGGGNHRMGLYDMFLIKDNHIEVAGSLTNAVKNCMEYRRRNNFKYKIEVETKNLDEVKEALESNADVIMLDNFSIPDMKAAVDIINGKCIIEASGGVNLNTIREIAETGVDFISVGAVTHSVEALDISLEIRSLN